MASEPPPQTPEGRYLGILSAIKGLTLQNVLIVALLVMIGIPAYTLWRALNDESLMDRLLSVYEEEHDRSGCLIRHVSERGGPHQWGISSGFAFQGSARWFVSVILSHEPSPEEIASYCESLKLIADTMVSGGADATVSPDTE